MSDHYVLNADHSVRPAELMEWARAFEDRDGRRVAKTELEPDVLISTVFLGLDHGLGIGKPLIFETMVFQGDMSDLLCWRYSTWEEAEAGHAKAVKLVERYLAEGRSLKGLYDDPEAEQP